MLIKTLRMLIALAFAGVGFYEGYSKYGMFEAILCSSIGLGLLLAVAFSNKKTEMSTE